VPQLLTREHLANEGLGRGRAGRKLFRWIFHSPLIAAPSTASHFQ
jgi:hypothetical protein